MRTCAAFSGRRSRAVVCALLLLANFGLALWPASAWAHNLGFGNDPNLPVLEYLWHRHARLNKPPTLPDEVHARVAETPALRSTS